jgi:DNA-binding MarR family transcriptional regulator
VKLEEAIKSNKFRSEVQKAGLNILYTSWWLKTMTSKELKKFGLTHEQFNVLRILKGKYPEQMCVRDVAGRMIEKNSNVPRIVDRLELKKFVKRSTSPNDKRETAIALTEAGINILEMATSKVNKLLDNTIALSESSAATLNKLLEEVRKNEK